MPVPWSLLFYYVKYMLVCVKYSSYVSTDLQIAIGIPVTLSYCVVYSFLYFCSDEDL